MKRVIRNVAASVRERLLNRARTEGEEFNFVLRRYFFERFLYRLGESSVSERFILKGAMLLQLWAEQPYRATIDLDLLRKGATDRESLTRDLREVMKTPVPDDAVVVRYRGFHHLPQKRADYPSLLGPEAPKIL